MCGLWTARRCRRLVNWTATTWRPAADTGADHGANGFHLDFADSGDFGLDALTGVVETEVASSSTLWQGSTGAFTHADDDVSMTGGDNAIRLTDDHLFTGDFEVSWTVTDNSGNPDLRRVRCCGRRELLIDQQWRQYGRRHERVVAHQDERWPSLSW